MIYRKNKYLFVTGLYWFHLKMFLKSRNAASKTMISQITSSILCIAVIFFGCVPESTEYRQFIREYKSGKYQKKTKYSVVVPQEFLNKTTARGAEWPKEFPNISIVPMSDLYKKNPSLPYAIYYMIGHDISRDQPLLSFLESVYENNKTPHLTKLNLKWHYGDVQDFKNSLINYNNDKDVLEKWKGAFQYSNWMKKWKSHYRDNRHAIICDGKLVGMIGIHSYGKRNKKSFDIMFLVNKDFRGNGYARYGVAKMFDDFFIEGKVKKYFNQVNRNGEKYDTINIAAERVNKASTALSEYLECKEFIPSPKNYGNFSGYSIPWKHARTFEMTAERWKEVRGDWITKTKEKIASIGKNKKAS